MQPQYKRDLLNRLRTVEGHVRAITRMVEEEQYCVDVLRQSMAVQGSLDRFNRLLLEHHLRTCFVAAIDSGLSQERERVIRELLDLVDGAPSIARREGAALAEALPATAGGA
ncbi:MAG: metal-sensitive transcriptional regulator [Chloroflexi bacterium]|nr:metal-sensitive transcriptional regulator [Chloroflexota bacterium]MBI4506625.1 metal-sensitive transcriptional regulator [Chloroflexota bacterium]